MAVSNVPIVWTTIEDTIHAWFSGQTGLTTVWANQNAPRPAHPYATLNIIAGPIKEGGIDEKRNTTDLTKARDIKVTPVAENNRQYTITINGTAFPFTSDADATIAEITAGLVAVINGGAEPVTATDNGTDLDIVGEDSCVFTVVLSDDGPGNLLSKANNDEGAEVGVEVVGYREITVSCQAMTREPDSNNPGANAKHFMSIAQTSLNLPSVLSVLRSSGISVIEEGAVSDISSEIEDEIESRAVMDVRFRIVSSVEERTGFMEDLTATGTFEGTADSPIVEDFSADN